MSDTSQKSLTKRPTNLAKRPATESIAVEVAPSLASASPKALLYVDGKGQVRSPERLRLLQTGWYAAMGSIVAGVTMLYGTLLGPSGLAVGAGFATYCGWQIHRFFKLRRASALLAGGYLEEAGALFKELLGSFRCPRGVRALAEQNLGLIAQRRGRHEEALLHQRAAMMLYAHSSPKSAFRQMVEYQEMLTLVNLGRQGEARQRFDQKRGIEPEGDLLKMLHRTAALYICLGEGTHRIDVDEFHEWAQTALGVTISAALLGLLAWAHETSGYSDEARHLLGEALGRRAGLHLPETLPRLWTWMVAEAEKLGLPME